jgi:hypothetical protein
MKNLVFLTTLFCLFSPFLKAQSVTWSDPFPTKNSYGRFNLTLNDIAGTPYLDSEYVLGTVTTNEGTLYKDIPLRYNCFNDVLEIKKDDQPYDLLPKEKASRAEFGGQIFCYLPYGNETNKAYFQVLTEGKARLCARYRVNFYEKEEAKGFADAKPARFDDLLETFWISVGQAPLKLILKKNQLLDVLSDKKNEVDAFLTKEKLSIKKPDDLKKIIKYYNTL